MDAWCCCSLSYPMPHPWLPPFLWPDICSLKLWLLGIYFKVPTNVHTYMHLTIIAVPTYPVCSRWEVVKVKISLTISGWSWFPLTSQKSCLKELGGSESINLALCWRMRARSSCVYLLTVTLFFWRQFTGMVDVWTAVSRRFAWISRDERCFLHAGYWLAVCWWRHDETAMIVPHCWVA